jgi:hypothetical protein
MLLLGETGGETEGERRKGWMVERFVEGGMEGKGRGGEAAGSSKRKQEGNKMM